MSGNDYAALYASVQSTLRNDSYGRERKHAMGSCPACHIIVCLSHHHCARKA